MIIPSSSKQSNDILTIFLSAILTKSTAIKTVPYSTSKIFF